MDLDTFFALHGIDRTKIVAAVEAEIGLQSDEVLFASGSLATGLGNAHSDLDLFVITRRDLSARAAFGQAVTFTLGRLQVDLEFVSPNHISNLVGRLHACHASVMGGEELKSLDVPPRDLDFLHRVLTGQPLAHGTRFNEVRDTVNGNQLRTVIVARSSVIASSEQEDFVGYLQEGDFDSARFAGARMLDAALDACLAALGNTMVKEKWRMRLVQRLATPGWDDDFPGGTLLPSLGVAYSGLHDWPRDHAEVAAHACALVRFVNRCIPWSQRCVYGLTRAKSAKLPLPRGEDGETLPHIASHVILRYHGRELFAFSFSYPTVLALDVRAHDALVYFDGRTSPLSLAERIASSAAMSTDGARRSLDQLSQVLFAAGFLDMAA